MHAHCSNDVIWSFVVDPEACLKAHNEKRALHKDTQPLEWDDGLAGMAKVWADHMMKIGEMKHSTNQQRPDQGENLYWSSRGTASTCTEAVKAWWVDISSQLEPRFQLGSSWVSFALKWIKLKFSPNSSHVFHRLATSASSRQLLPNCFVIVRRLRRR